MNTYRQHHIRQKAKALAILPLYFLTFLLFSCVDEEEFPDTAKGNFEALWKIIDEHYCFFDYKQHEYGLDWNNIYNIYKVRARDGVDKYQLFEVLTDMLAELRDGHVNLYSSFDNGRYWSWHEDYPTNFSDTLQRKYLGTDYLIASGMRYRILDDNIGYMYYGSFTNPISDSGLNEILRYFAFCNGLIIDIRSNGGPNSSQPASATRKRWWATSNTRRERAITTSPTWSRSISSRQQTSGGRRGLSSSPIVGYSAQPTTS